MTVEKFKDFNPRGSTLNIIDQANAIIAEYQDQGFVLTTRQLYYQFVARGLIANTPAEYKRLGVTVCHARDGGLIDWEAIEDRSREVNTHNWWGTPGDIIESAAASYREDLWEEQQYRPEVWVEKDALVGVIEAVCTDHRVPFFGTRGNVSQPLAYHAGKRFADQLDQGLTPVILHLADHDPTGIDMTRDLQTRISLYAEDEVEVRRIALNIDQVRRYRPPPNPAKELDSRFRDYANEFGTDSWELDALSPTVIASLIRSELEAMIDQKLWQKAKKKEDRARRRLAVAAANWPLVETMMVAAKLRG